MKRGDALIFLAGSCQGFVRMIFKKTVLWIGLIDNGLAVAIVEVI